MWNTIWEAFKNEIVVGLIGLVLLIMAFGLVGIFYWLVIVVAGICMFSLK